ncbi:calcitonin gene-related peptide type 1 receptor-like protein [Dinothrombium tinctorium]|uniref:Calcitonin gene-related peptide type 1 receptor-like protein n=1 Tax=Dinothrombium tinctorium TaxID=1965070 RepID=A0A3S3PT09_9ACAR|nr:calcitonin gene-related peptide type 1 receptor-like protein [Dinothrombium tinctorium]
MFCEGLYLHTLLVIAFVSEEKILKWFYIIGWGLPLIFIALYASFRGASPSDTELCWIEDSKYLWWIYVPVCVSFMLNLFFLINIVRLLVTKLRAVNSPDTHQTSTEKKRVKAKTLLWLWKAVRATLILIPLLGLHYLITPFRPQPQSPGEAVYEVFAAIVTSLQVS